MADALFDDLHQPRLAEGAVEQLGIGQAPTSAPARQTPTVDPARQQAIRQAVLLAFQVHGALEAARVYRVVNYPDDEVREAFTWLIRGSRLVPAPNSRPARRVWMLAPPSQRKGSR